MSVFAGKFSDGKTVFSINTQAGGDTSLHTNPNNNSIFHSDMPHLFVESSHTEWLAHSGSNYWTCAVPNAVLDALYNSAGRVVLVEYVYNNGGERSHLIQGGSMGAGDRVYAEFAFTPPMGGGAGGSRGHGRVRVRLAPSMDTVLHCGYYPGGGGSVQEQVARGTGGVYDFTGTCGGSNIGGPMPINYMAAGLGLYENDGATDPNVINNTWRANIDQVFAPNTYSRDFNRFFVRQMTPPRQVGDTPNTAADPIPAMGVESAIMASGQKGASGPPWWAARSSRQNTENWYNAIHNIVDWFPGTPVRVVWHITNITYNGWDNYSATNPFTGNEILISPNNFIIKGVSMMSQNRTMVTQMGRNANLGSRPDSVNIGTNIWSGSPNAVDVPPLGFATDYGASGAEGGVGGGSWGGSVFNLTKFLPNTQWFVDSTRSAIGNQYGDVWSPNRNPLKLLAGSTASTDISSGAFMVSPGSTSVELGTWWLGMGDGNAVLATMHFYDMTWMTCGGMTGSQPLPNSAGDQYGKQRLAFTGGSRPNNWSHQILTLPSWQYVPVYAVYSAIQGNTSGVTWNLPASLSRLSQIYYLRNLGDGRVQLICAAYNQTGETVRLQTPNMRFTIQRLT